MEKEIKKGNNWQEPMGYTTSAVLLVFPIWVGRILHGSSPLLIFLPTWSCHSHQCWSGFFSIDSPCLAWFMVWYLIHLTILDGLTYVQYADLWLISVQYLKFIIAFLLVTISASKLLYLSLRNTLVLCSYMLFLVEPVFREPIYKHNFFLYIYIYIYIYIY